MARSLCNKAYCAVLLLNFWKPLIACDDIHVSSLALPLASFPKKDLVCVGVYVWHP
jgi:hypothetical protein